MSRATTDQGWILGLQRHLRTPKGQENLLDVEVIDQGDVVGGATVESLTTPRTTKAMSKSQYRIKLMKQTHIKFIMIKIV